MYMYLPLIYNIARKIHERGFYYKKISVLIKFWLKINIQFFYLWYISNLFLKPNSYWVKTLSLELKIVLLVINWSLWMNWFINSPIMKKWNIWRRRKNQQYFIKTMGIGNFSYIHIWGKTDVNLYHSISLFLITYSESKVLLIHLFLRC